MWDSLNFENLAILVDSCANVCGHFLRSPDLEIIDQNVSDFLWVQTIELYSGGFIRGGGGGHPDPEIRGARFQIFFSALRVSVWSCLVLSKNKRGRGAGPQGPSPGSATALCGDLFIFTGAFYFTEIYTALNVYFCFKILSLFTWNTKASINLPTLWNAGVFSTKTVIRNTLK